MERKRIFTMVAVAVIALGAGTAIAGPHHRGMHPDGMMERLADDLELSAEQREAVRGGMEDRRERMQALHAELRANHQQLGALDPADPNYETLVNSLAQRQGELTSEMALLRSRAHAELMGVLTDEQKARLGELRAERKARREERREHWRDYRGGGEDPADETL